jgi:hypothetical protein
MRERGTNRARLVLIDADDKAKDTNRLLDRSSVNFAGGREVHDVPPFFSWGRGKVEG